MSTISTVTISAVCDSILGDEHEIANCIYILIATHGDGTPFSPNSFQEEDFVELCMGWGQAHLEGELQISETEVVLAFWSTTELTATTCLLSVVIVWHNEPIKLHVHPPTNTQAREYVAARGQCPSGTQALGWGREVVSQSPLVTFTLKGASPQFHIGPQRPQWCPIKASYGGYPAAGSKKGSTAPPRGSPIWCQWAPAKGVDTDFEDEEMTLQGGGVVDLASHHNGPQGPLKQRRMLVTSSAHLSPD